MPKVAVLIASYQHAPYLPGALQSVLDQTFSDWTVIICDDGSTDGSREFLSTIAHSRVTVMLNEHNLGTYGTQQKMLEKTDSEYVAILNSDDLWRRGKLAAQVAAMDSSHGSSFCFHKGSLIDSAGNEIGHVQPDFPGGSQSYLPRLIVDNQILASSVMFRREGLRFNPELRYSGDWCALLEACLRGPGIGLDQVLSHWRQHDHNTFRRSRGQVDEEIRIRRAILEHPRFGEFMPERSLCAAHLMALYALTGQQSKARKLSHELRYLPRTFRMKRKFLAMLPAAIARKRLFPGEAELSPLPDGQAIVIQG